MMNKKILAVLSQPDAFGRRRDAGLVVVSSQKVGRSRQTSEVSETSEVWFAPKTEMRPTQNRS